MKIEVQVLLSYYNGEKYIKEQVESIHRQEGPFKVKLLIRDDGSPEPFPKFLKEGNQEVIAGTNIGPKLSFLELLKKSDSSCSYFAFSDQDDYWESDKLAVAVEKLKKYEEPALYISKTQLTDLNLKKTGLDNFEEGAFSFGRIVIKNNGVGCTMVMNKALRDTVNSISIKSNNSNFLHDHLIYMICLGVGGTVIYDSTPHIFYRQHEKNVVGDRSTLLEKITDNGFFDSRKIRYHWCEELYVNYGEVLTSENREFLEEILSYDKKLTNKIKLCISKKFDTRSILEKLNLSMLILLGKY
ncbi:glycosyltransferase [Enterococcus sp. LJL51]|uniref:glycosyltransferase n=1 Tax=Enterococcus sp. LJL51 TaxID=3416656 RepID=UPI003CEB9CCD